MGVTHPLAKVPLDAARQRLVTDHLDWLDKIARHFCKKTKFPFDCCLSAAYRGAVRAAQTWTPELSSYRHYTLIWARRHLQYEMREANPNTVVAQGPYGECQYKAVSEENRTLEGGERIELEDTGARATDRAADTRGRSDPHRRLDTRDAVEFALGTIEGVHLDVIRLKFFEYLDNETIAKVLMIPKRTVCHYQHVALKHMREMTLC